MKFVKDLKQISLRNFKENKHMHNRGYTQKNRASCEQEKNHIPERKAKK